MKNNIRYILIIIVLAIVWVITLVNLIPTNVDISSTEDYMHSSANIALIMSPSGPGDRSLNDASFQGALQAQTLHGINFSMRVPESLDDYESLLKSVAVSKNYDLIIMIGGAEVQTKALENVAKLFPEQKFSQIDSTLELDNVSAIQTIWQENTFLTGVVAGLGTKSKMPLANRYKQKVGILIGEEIPLMDRAIVGFAAGAKLVNPEVEVVHDFVGSFLDADGANIIARRMFKEGVDFLQVIGGGNGIGVVIAATDEGAYVFGAGASINAIAPNNIVATAYRDVAGIIFDEIVNVINGEWSAGLHVSGVSGAKIGYDAFLSKVEVPKEIQEIMYSLQDRLINNEIEVPYAWDDLSVWLEENKLEDFLNTPN